MMARYVETAVARDAVKGREYEILQKTGVDWRPGQKAHCTCPYHGGKGDFRFVEKTGKIFCTCLQKPHSIFDHISKMRGQDPQEDGAYEASKVEAMEMLGRQDLIKENSVKVWHEGLKTHLLLNPPVHLRDDTMVRVYLGNRTKVAPEDAAVPTTPFVGIKELELFHEGEVVHKGPCIIFFMVDPDTKEVVGAIRTYLSPCWTEKADIPYDIKRMIPGTKVGGEVQFGDPDTATKKKTCEGVENGSAVEFAEKRRGDGDTLVVATGNTTYLKGSKVQPNIEVLYIAADRDEEPNEQGVITYAGQKAGEHLAAKHSGRIPVHLALPGELGTKTDWLDVLTKSGHDAVYDGIMQSPMQSPVVSVTKSEDAPRERESRDDLKSAAETYPAPRMNSEQFRYDKTQNGETWLYRRRVKKEDAKKDEAKKGDAKEDKKEVEYWVPVCTPFAVTHRIVPLDSGSGPDYALRIAVQGMTGQLHLINLARSLIAKSGAADIKSLLFRAGLRTEGDGDNVAVSILKAANPEREIKVAPYPGWHRVDGVDAPVFIAPTGEIIGVSGCQDIELTESAKILERDAKAGTFDEWKFAADVIAKTNNVNHWRIAICAAFAGVLVDLLNMDTMGICMTGISSRGKSTAQRIAVSAWGNPSLSAETLNHSALTTVNAVEVKAQRSNGSILGLDDLKNMRGKEIASLIYKLAGNVGKGRMKANIELRQSMRWKTFALMSIEKTLEQAILEDGGEYLPGIAVRIPDVNVTSCDEKVPPEIMSEIVKGPLNFGHAGPEFVRCLIASGQHKDPDSIRSRIDNFARKLAGSDDSETVRAATPFAVVMTAGIMAKSFGILPSDLDVRGSVKWGWQHFKSDSDVGHDRQDDAIDVLHDWLAANWNVKVVSTRQHEPRIPPEAWYDDDYVYINAKSLTNIIPKTIRAIDFADTLRDADILVPDERSGKNSHTKARTGSKKLGSCYWLKRERIGQPKNEDENMRAAQEEENKVVNMRGRS